MMVVGVKGKQGIALRAGFSGPADFHRKPEDENPGKAR
jgi:hypothetical protein